ncbi:MAG: LPS assembly protein LptD [Moraxella sp.]|uniref:LPS-assembly protein LptD n=1 Tax=Moraxella sp. TaxID=479 RepID=UPI0026DD93B6|nr:LPS assembly protein LptD [Moraxella sp.]MDO4451161.1 LPS assembly protein LptD [Moraxella sp.]
MMSGPIKNPICTKLPPKKHELAVCVGVALCGVMPTLTHAQGFVTSDDITVHADHVISYNPNHKNTQTITPTTFVTSNTPSVFDTPNKTLITSDVISDTAGKNRAIPTDVITSTPTIKINNDNYLTTSDHTTTKHQSLTKLAKYYQPKTTHQVARCEGEWVSPNHVSLDTHGNRMGTFFAQADYGYYDNADYAELSGNAIIEQNGQQISADKLIYQPSTGAITAQGQVLFSDGTTPHNTKSIGTGMIGMADSLHYADNGNTAIAHDVAFASTTMNAHGYAQTLRKVDDDRYRMQEVTFSTCPPNERKWHIDADSIDINNDTGRGIAKNSTLKIGNTPVFYLPYFNFPIDGRRSSGFLLPNVGLNSDSLEVSTPYYLNLAPNYDVTITPTIFSDKNPMLTGEFRYLTKHLGAGVLRGSYLPSDRKYYHQNRESLFYNHLWQSARYPHLSAYANYRYVSDSNYLNDFDTLGIEGNPLNLPRNIGANYYNDYISADLRAETFQTLHGKNNDGTTILDKDKPYSRLPQLSVNYRLPPLMRDFGFLNRLNIEGVHNSAYFKKSIRDNSEAEKSGFRMYNQLSASHSLTKSWGYITPKISLIHLYASYDEDSLLDQELTKEEGTYSVFVPQVGIDAGLFFEKAGSPFGLYDDTLGGYQVIMPRLKYIHTPYKDQQQIPNFETAIGQISYERLLSDSWLLGYDRIQDLHAITPALNYRYIDRMGNTRFDGGIAQQIYLDDTHVSIDNDESSTNKNSGLAWRASAQPWHHLWVEAGGAFSSNYRPNSFIAQFRYQPDEQRLYNFGIIERKDHLPTGQLALSAYTASAVFPINNRWQALTQVQYDHKNDRLLDALVGINYEDCCYGLSVYARRYRNDLDTDTRANNAIMAEIRLNGITNGGKLSRLMSDKVMGYDSVNQAWQQAY